ncbi:unnamed protein product [Paramecium sonneborni]|uniref:Uncharacterized protein n=1 Tax=Paramecium sonneborni TaxID=65129 RepID=A0A8S1RIQ8_9CILI|nr:unnamed protein product [Paramecium sonneborni]
MKTNWGQTILQLAQLHAHTGGVLQDLVGANEEMIQQMQDELTNEHNSLSLLYTQEVQRSVITLENLLYPRREQLMGQIQQLIDNQEFNKKTVDEGTLIKEQEHEAFETQVAGLNDAVGATVDALNLLSTFTILALNE